MNLALWIVASVLALGFLGSGLVKLLRTREQVVGLGFGWAEGYSRSAVKLIGVAEVAGAAGLILPPALGILPILSPIAATGLAVLMAGAIVVHARRREPAGIVVPAILFLLSAVVAIGRFWCPY